VNNRSDRASSPENDAVAPISKQEGPRADKPVEVSPNSRSVGTPAGPELDSIEDRVIRERIHASLFAADRAGVWIDRFELIGKLGAGGMGTVWSATDHRLQRRVALKFLRSRSDGAAGEQRLFREAQALARIAHPNVIAVFDVGRHEGRIWVAMELVSGTTLRARAEADAGAGILAVWMAAGRGLAAIHGAGLVHRDVKPDNVLIGDDGRVRVIDFGLVRAAGASASASGTAPPQSPDMDAAVDAVDQLFTQTEQFVGTPAYAAPEQVAGKRVDARADQYSFCVALWEALAGARPTSDDRPNAQKIATRVRTALSRGLCEDPAERFADMDALLAALAPPKRQWTVPAVVGVGLAAGIGAGAAGVFDAAALPPAPEPCARAGEGLDTVWSQDARDRVGASLPPDLAAFATSVLDGWAAAWRETAIAACRDVHVHGRASMQSLDVRGHCLDGQRRELESVLSLINDAGFADVAQARLDVVAGVSALGEPSTCLNLQSDPVAGLEQGELREYHRIADALFELELRRQTQSIGNRRARARSLYEDALRHGFRSLQARASVILGNLAIVAGDRQASAQLLGRAIDLAERERLHPLRVTAWLTLVETELAAGLGAGERALWNWDRARGALGEVSAPHPLHGQTQAARARIHLAMGELVDAAATADDALERLQALGKIRSRQLARTLRLRALIASRRGNSELALTLQARARAGERARAPDDEALPVPGNDVLNRGLALLDAGDLPGAQATLVEARTKIEVEYGPTPTLVNAHVALAAVADAQGDLEAMRAHAEAADALVVELQGPAHADRIYTLSARGTAAFRSEAFAAAVADFALSLQLAELELAPGSPDLAMMAVNLAEARNAQGQYAAAEFLLVGAIATLEAALGEDHADLAIAYKGLGAAMLGTGRKAEAQVHLRRALVIHGGQGGQNLVEVAQTQWLLARALSDGDGRTTEALQLAEEARAAYASLGPSWAARHREIGLWLKTQPTPFVPEQAP